MDEFEWDDTKSKANRLKHGIGFELVFEFEWSTASYQVDERFDYGEERIRAFGRIDRRPFCVVYTQRRGRLRIISVRPMHEREASEYGI